MIEMRPGAQTSGNGTHIAIAHRRRRRSFGSRWRSLPWLRLLRPPLRDRGIGLIPCDMPRTLPLSLLPRDGATSESWDFTCIDGIESRNGFRTLFQSCTPHRAPSNR